MKNYILLVIAIALDLVIGDPVTYIHPVRLIGNLILKIENFLYNISFSKRVTGFIGVSISLGTVLIIFFILYNLTSFIPYGKEVFTVLVFYSTIAIKDLVVHGMRVKKALDNDNILLARKSAGMILSRDIDKLSPDKIITGTVESMSENSSDSIIAPIFWGLIFGPAGALAYRVINTMDAMWGYKNERFIDFGRAAALLDDAVNFIPARITGLLICFSSLLTPRWGSGLNEGNPLTTWRIMIRDHKNTASPNAGYSEAAMAGILSIQLGGEASYFGEIIEKPTIGNNTRQPEAKDILKSIRIIAVSLTLFLLFSAIIIVIS
ncbi:MAG: adenosylcobinamide-phosphate synthase CbiB [Spirochaetia bacterium]|jgi:adenosylcobinamide-phosphate synthase|nr:adenosylcobinamide-phosphate synthase CbiB [Spirochaetia bacterium]